MSDWAAVIREIAPRAKAKIVSGLAEAMPKVIEIADLSSPLRQQHFLAQLAHESAGFQTTEEYASGSAYEGRRDLGNIKRGDGTRFKGRGLIQLTGRANYARVGHILGVDFVENPKSAGQFPWAALSAAVFWREHNINEAADSDDIRRVTRIINGGYNGLDDRRAYLKRAKRALDTVRGAQRRLTALNYPCGSIDGETGALTRSAVRDFQDANGLPVTGVLDQKTLALLYRPDAKPRPVSAARAALTVDDLRKDGSKVVAAADEAKFGAVGAGIATISAVASEAKDLVSQVDDIKAGVKAGADTLEILRDYWPVIVCLLAVAATIFFVWRAYRGAVRAQAERVENARAGVNVRI